MTELKEAAYYNKTSKNEVLCTLCPHMCRLGEEEHSPCGTRMLVDGKLRALSYGRLIAANIDPVEKKPLYHFMPGSYTYSIGTAGCNMHCLNCQNADISQAKIDKEQGQNSTPQDIVEAALDNNLESISYTYTEPTIFFELMRDTAKIAREKGMKNIMVSNGYINPKPLRELLPLLDAVNIDMKAFNSEIYEKLTGAKLDPVLKSIETLHQSEVHMEITLLLIPGYSDKDEDLAGFFKWMTDRDMHEVPLHISRFFPTYRLLSAPPTPEPEIFEVRQKALDAGLKFVFPGNVSGGDAMNTYCPECGTLAINRDRMRAENKLKDGKFCTSCGYQVITDS